jgi:hypothetical protein
MTYRPRHTLSEIQRLTSEGLTHSQIADLFDISTTRVWQIVKQEQQRIVSADRSAAICNEIMASNDLGRKLTLDELFCVLNLSKKAEAVLRRHLTQQGVTGFSLRDMMDFLIPIVDDATAIDRIGVPIDFEKYYRHMPAYRVKMLGQILYADMIKALSALDCGEVFRTEWVDRKRRLRDYLIGTGHIHPYFLNGKNAALR